jgi:hypothetical protein
MLGDEAGGRMTQIRVEALSSATLGLLVMVTIAFPRWLEAVTGVDADGGSGAVEWAVVCFCAAGALATGLHAGRRLRAHRAAV